MVEIQILVSTLPYIFSAAILNRMRGSRIYNLTTSTELGRIVSAMGFGLLASFLEIGNNILMLEMFAWVFLSILLWSTPAWDKYWSEEIGHDPNHTRLYGLMQMTIRMQLIVPCFIGIAFISGHLEQLVYLPLTLLLGIPYYIWGYISKNYAIPFSEYTIGGMLGLYLRIFS